MRCDEGKTRYESHAAATKTIIVIAYDTWKKQQRGSKMNKTLPTRTYLCPFCGAWHLTSHERR